MLREWGMARGRVEAEIQRRKEHNVDGSNFQKARGWVRHNWRTKNHDFRNETHDDFIQLSDSEEDDEAHELEDRTATRKRPKFVDLAADSESYGVRATSEQQREQLQSIIGQNERLPPKKRAKDSLPEISATNMHLHITNKITIPKKPKGAKPVVERTKKYVNVGLGDPVLPMGFESKAASLNDGMLDVQ
jgi:hypothetical protein